MDYLLLAFWRGLRACTANALLSASVFAATIALTLFLLRTPPTRRSVRLPPGPRRLPFIGNVHQLPAEYQQDAFAKWGKQYGALTYVQFFNAPALIVNRTRTALDLLEKRGAKSSSRPYFTYLADIVQWDSVVLLPYSGRWRRHRRWLQMALLERKTLNSYRPLQQEEVQTMLRDTLREPEGVLGHLTRFTAAVMLGIAYGHSPTSLADDYIKRTEEAISLAIEGGGPASNLVDFFPVLKYVPSWVPGMGFKRRGLRARTMIRDTERIPLETLMRKMDAGTAKPCMGTSLLEEAARKGRLDKSEIREIELSLSIIYMAGTETTATTLSTFVLLMMLHPDVQRKAQQELDRIIGDTRLPTSNDTANLPYLNAVLKEVYRWLAPAPLGTPHMLTEPDEYSGYNLAKGTIILTNVWAMSRDEEYFPDPDRFDPERFLDPSLSAGATDPDAQDPRKFVFGFGRRLCPGRLLAESSILLAMAHLLCVFDIVPPPEGCDTQRLLHPTSFTSGIVRHPKSFQCRVMPRSERKAELIHAARE